jgi:multidrug efflux pump subunit AcrB
VGIVLLNFYLMAIVPRGLFPQQDTGQIMVSTKGPQDISFPAMKKREEGVIAALKKDPAINHFTAFMGGGPGSGAGNTGTMFMELKPLEERKASAMDIINRLRPKVAKEEGIATVMQPSQDVRIGGRSTEAQYQYSLEDANLDELNTWAPRVLRR